MTGIILFLLAILAGPFRAVAFRSGGFDNRKEGIATWSGVVLAFLFTSGLWSDIEVAPATRWSWLVVATIAYSQTVKRWIWPSPPKPRSFWAVARELAFAAVLSFLAEAALGTGQIFLVGYLCAILHRGISRIRARFRDWAPEDTRRIVDAIRAVRGGATSSARRAAMFGQSAATLMLRVASLLSGNVLLLGSIALRGLKDRQARRATDSGPYRRPTFASRVMSVLVGHLIFQVITGALGLWGIVKIAGIILAIPLAIIGWKVTPPDSQMDEARTVFSRLKDSVDDKKDGLYERMEEEQRRLRERAGELKDEVERRKRNAIWDFFTK